MMDGMVTAHILSTLTRSLAGLVIGHIYLALIDPLDVLVYLLLQSLPLNIIHVIISQHR